MRPSSSAFLAWNSSSVRAPGLVQAAQLVDLVGRRRPPAAARGRRRRDPVEPVAEPRPCGSRWPPSGRRSRSAPRRACGCPRSTWAPFSLADSILRSPRPSIRSKIRWLKKMVLMRSSGISMPCLAMHARAVDDPVAGEHEVGADPLDEPLGQPDQGAQDQQARRDPHGADVDVGQHQHPHDERGHRGDEGAGEVPPVRVEIEDELLAVAEDEVGVRHPAIVVPTSWLG